MNHVDEGTIHAWLDGALDAERARAVESHAASCAQCSAAVAEARGLIAGASRILTALDDVPAGVVPGGKSAAPAWGPRAKRQWRAAPWVTGIAAALILGVGLTQWRRDQAGLDAYTSFKSTPTQADARARADAESVAAARLRAQVPAVRDAQATASRRATEATGAAGAGGGIADARGPRTSVGAVSPAPAPAQAARQEVAAAAAVADKEPEKRAVAPALPKAELVPPPPTAPAAMMKDAAADVVTERSRDVAAAGCYRIAPEVVARTQVAEAAKAAGAASSRAPAAAAPRAALAEAPTLPEPPTRVQLDTSPAARGFVARRVTTGERLGYWFRAGDSLRVELLAAGAYTIPTTARVPCP